MKWVIYIIICIIGVANLSAQDTLQETPSLMKAKLTLKGSADKKQYMVGDPIEYTFSLPKTNKTLNFTSDFQFSDTLQLVFSKIDTTDDKINYTYTFSSFVEGMIKLPEFQFYEADKTTPLYNIESPMVDIQMPAIDTTTIEVKPLKSIMKIPLTLKEIIPFSIGGIVLVGIVVAIIYFIRYIENRLNRQENKRPKTEIVVPEDEEALNNLSRLRQAHLLEMGQEKQHYIALSEILWQYLYRRFDVNAFEMTTSQIMKDMQQKEVDPNDNDKLNNIFSTSDLVKFAKYLPDTKTNLTILQDSEDFIKQYKHIIIEENTNVAKDNQNFSLDGREGADE